jgi:APA family basic amino acid/polyamine antiporter
MSLVAAVYAELATRMPVAGGDFIYAYKLFGPRVGFLIGWFVTLYLVAVTAFEAISLPWLLGTLLPGLGGAVLYTILGQTVTLDAVLLGVTALLLITFFNYRDVRLAVAFQSIITYGFLAAVLLVVLLGATTGHAENIRPLFASEGGVPWWLGTLWITANCAFFLTGFQAIPQTIEERAENVSPRTVARVMLGCVAAATVFYCAVIVSSTLSTPWRTLANSDLAAAVAVEHVLPGGWLARLVLVVAAASLLKTWNAVAMMASRILMAQAREGLLSSRFMRLHPRYATPGEAVLFVSLCTVVGIILGRGAIVPLINMASICVTFSLVTTCLGLLKLRAKGGRDTTDFTVPGGSVLIVVATVASALMSLFALFEPLYRSGGAIPLEWILLSAWGLLGVSFYSMHQRARL